MKFNVFVLFFFTFTLSTLTALITNNNISNYIIQITVFSLFITIFFYFLFKLFKISIIKFSLFLILIISLPVIFNFSTLDFLKTQYNKNIDKHLSKYKGNKIPQEFFKKGWYPIEQNLCWGEKNAVLSIPIKKHTENANIYIEFFTITNKMKTPQIITFKSCGNVIKNYKTKKTFNRFITKIHIPRECIKDKIDIHISSSYEVIPINEGFSGDIRKLGFAIASIYIKENIK